MEVLEAPESIEYVREKRLVETLITGKPSNTSAAVSLTALAFIALITFGYWNEEYKDMAKLLPVSGDALFAQGEWWRAFTATLIHSDIGHLLSNSYMLLIFSYFIYGYFGFGIYPVSAFLLSAGVNVFTVTTYPTEVRLLGASGMVYLLGGFWLTSYFLIQRQYRLLPRFLRILGIGLMVFFPTSFVPNTSYMAHAVGFAFGIGLGILNFTKNKKKIRSYERYKHTLVEAEVPH